MQLANFFHSLPFPLCFVSLAGPWVTPAPQTWFCYTPAAIALKRQGYSVHMFTSHHEPDRCFEETCDGTLRVTVYGDWYGLPHIHHALIPPKPKLSFMRYF